MAGNPAVWFEIPVTDMDRAIAFYETVFGYTLQRQSMPNVDMAWFPMKKDGAGATGTLIKNEEFYMPSKNGTLIYLAAPSGNLSNELERAKAKGAAIVVEKRQISKEYGYMAVIIDSEGNRIALHSEQ
jgi:hypothetical protein